MVQVAATLPIFLLAIPAGVLGDILDRRKLLIGVQVALALVSLCLTLLAALDALTVPVLIALTFVGGAGFALMGPSWQAIVPELVPRGELRNAIALNSLGFNISRAIGPALGGAALASFGAAVTFGIDVLTYGAVIAALVWWPRATAPEDPLAERFTGALRAGIRFARASRELHVVLLRAALFFLAASSLWALLPLIARNLLSGGPSFYGILLGAIGTGAVAGAVVMPKIRAALGVDRLLFAATLASAFSMAVLAMAPPQWLAVLVLVLMGGGWIAALTTLNAATQVILPNWVRGRGLSIYLTVFNGALAAGSAIWGGVAEVTGVVATLLLGAVALVLVGLFSPPLASAGRRQGTDAVQPLA